MFRLVVATRPHAEFHRPTELRSWDAGSTNIRKEALADLQLLADVVKHKQTFYPSSWARATISHDPETCGLYHRRNAGKNLQGDYRQMGVMIFGNPPPFETVIETLTALENEINGKDVRVYGSGNAQ